MWLVKMTSQRGNMTPVCCVSGYDLLQKRLRATLHRQNKMGDNHWHSPPFLPQSRYQVGFVQLMRRIQENPGMIGGRFKLKMCQNQQEQKKLYMV